MPSLKLNKTTRCHYPLGETCLSMLAACVTVTTHRALCLCTVLVGLRRVGAAVRPVPPISTSIRLRLSPRITLRAAGHLGTWCGLQHSNNAWLVTCEDAQQTDLIPGQCGMKADKQDAGSGKEDLQAAWHSP